MWPWMSVGVMLSGGVTHDRPRVVEQAAAFVVTEAWFVPLRFRCRCCCRCRYPLSRHSQPKPATLQPTGTKMERSESETSMYPRTSSIHFSRAEARILLFTSELFRERVRARRIESRN